MRTGTQGLVLAVAGLLVCLLTPSAAVVPIKGPEHSLVLPENLQEQLEALIANRPHGHRSALSVTVFTRDNVLPVSAYTGYAKIHRKVPSHPLVIFPAGKLGNPVIASLVLNKVHKEHLDLDVPVNQYLPVGSPLRGPDGQPNNKITLRHLLSHSSGLPVSSWDSIKYPDHEKQDPPSIEDYVKNSGGFDCIYEAGEKVLESADGIAIAAILGAMDHMHRGFLFEATVNYDVMMKTWMVSSTFDPRDDHWSVSDRVFALMYGDGVEEASEEEWMIRPMAIRPGGTFYTTGVDMAYLTRVYLPGPESGRALHDGDFMTPKLASEALTIHARESEPYEGWDEGMGLGWNVRHGRPGLGSTAGVQSSGPGHTSSCQMLMDYGVSITVLSNMAGNEEEVHNLMEAVIRILLNPPVPTQLAQLTVPLEHLPGTYAALDGVDPKWWYHHHFYNFYVELADDGKSLTFWDPWTPLHKGVMKPIGATRYLVHGGPWHGSLAEFRTEEDLLVLGPGLRARHVHVLASGAAKQVYAGVAAAAAGIGLLAAIVKRLRGPSKAGLAGKKDS